MHVNPGVLRRRPLRPQGVQHRLLDGRFIACRKRHRRGDHVQQRFQFRVRLRHGDVDAKATSAAHAAGVIAVGDGPLAAANPLGAGLAPDVNSVRADQIGWLQLVKGHGEEGQDLVILHARDTEPPLV